MDNRTTPWLKAHAIWVGIIVIVALIIINIVGWEGSSKIASYIFLILWVGFFGYVCGNMAHEKNRDVFLWVCLGIMYSFLALAVIMMLKPKPK